MGIFKRKKSAVPGLSEIDRHPTEVLIETDLTKSSRKYITKTAPVGQSQEQYEISGGTGTPSGNILMFDFEQGRSRTRFINSGISDPSNLQKKSMVPIDTHVTPNQFDIGNQIGCHRKSAGHHGTIHGKQSMAEKSKGSTDETAETTRGSCMTLEEVFAGLYFCGPYHKDTQEAPELEDDTPNIRSVPSEISFTKNPPQPWEESHVLLTEVEDDNMSEENSSMTGSLLKRLTRRSKAKETVSPKMKVYVEPPRTRDEQASVDDSAITGPGSLSTGRQHLTAFGYV
jgi:hypothetical protein